MIKDQSNIHDYSSVSRNSPNQDDDFEDNNVPYDDTQPDSSSELYPEDRDANEIFLQDRHSENRHSDVRFSENRHSELHSPRQSWIDTLVKIIKVASRYTCPH